MQLKSSVIRDLQLPGCGSYNFVPIYVTICRSWFTETTGCALQVVPETLEPSLQLAAAVLSQVLIHGSSCKTKCFTCSNFKLDHFSSFEVYFVDAVP